MTVGSIFLVLYTSFFFQQSIFFPLTALCIKLEVLCFFCVYVFNVFVS